MDEKQMREAEVPHVKSANELQAYIDDLVSQQHDYGTCVYAMSMAAVAAFNYVAGQLGVTGFQASCADLDILRRTRRMECPFMISKLSDALYPQYDLPGALQKFMDENRGWLRDEANKLLIEDPRPVAEAVRNHWVKLAEGL